MPLSPRVGSGGRREPEGSQCKPGRCPIGHLRAPLPAAHLFPPLEAAGRRPLDSLVLDPSHTPGNHSSCEMTSRSPPVTPTPLSWDRISPCTPVHARFPHQAETTVPKARPVGDPGTPSFPVPSDKGLSGWRHRKLPGLRHKVAPPHLAALGRRVTAPGSSCRECCQLDWHCSIPGCS